MMAYAAALPFERPAKLSAWEIPFAVAGALVDCLTCGVRSSGDLPASEERYWPPAVPPYPAPTYNAGPPYLSGDNVELKAVFTDIPLREEAIRQGFIQPAEGESPYTTLYKPPLGPAVPLVPVEPAAAGYPASVTAAAIQKDVDAARTAGTVQRVFVAPGAVTTPSVAVVPTCFDRTLQPAAAAAGNGVLRSPYETVSAAVQQQGPRTLQQTTLQREEDIVAAFRRLYAPPVIPGTYEVYSPSGSWAPTGTMQRRYIYAAPTTTVSQAVQTVFEEEVARDASVGGKTAPLAGTEVASTEKDTSHTEQTSSEGRSPFQAGGREWTTKGERTERKEQADETKAGSLEVVEVNKKGGDGGKDEQGSGGGQCRTTPAGAAGEQPLLQMQPLPTEERITTNTSAPDQLVFQQTQLEWASAADRGPIGFVPPVPPQQYKQIYVGGRPYLQGGVFYLSDTGAYLLGI